MDSTQDLNISTAAAQMGITPEAVRKRIARGTLRATKQEGRWHVDIGEATRQDTGKDTGQDDHPNDKDRLIQALTDELTSRRQEIQQLHVLLQSAQTALTPAPERRPWWRWWK